MRIKRIEADNITEAMRELRRELSEGALILHTKQLPPRGVAGWFKSPRVEILGAVDEPELVASSVNRPVAGVGARAAAAQPIAPAPDSFAALVQAQLASTSAISEPAIQ